MNRTISVAAFVLGAIVVAWVGVGYLGARAHALALGVTVIIASVYLVGAYELLAFRRATASLAAALATIPQPLANLAEWLERVPPTLQNPVRLRVEGERGGLPGPTLTPYLVGLLVMLGMLGTFLGMVVTLNGAVFALEGTTDLQAIRAALAAPIRGLGVAFGTSVAGVAASAMLGLISALCRRERLLCAQLLDSKIATVLRGFSLTHQRQQTFAALQWQAQALPAVVDQLQALIEQLARREERLSERLLGNQQSFHGEVRDVYTTLAGAVEKSLHDSLTQGAQLAGEALTAAVDGALAGIAREANGAHQRMALAAQGQLDALAARLAASADGVAQHWSAALARQETTNDALLAGVERSQAAFNATFAHGAQSLLAALGEASASALAAQRADEQQRLDAWQRSLDALAGSLAGQWRAAGERSLAQQQDICATLSATARDVSAQLHADARATLAETTRLLGGAEELLRARRAQEAQWSRQQDERMEQLLALWRDEQAALRDQEALRGDAAVARLGELQAALATHLTTLGAALEAPLTRLIETASAAPRAAAQVIGELRQEMANSSARDNQLLDERSQLMAALNALLVEINRASGEQRAAVDTLVGASAALLEQAGSRLAEQAAEQAGRLSDVAAQIGGSAVEVASLSEALAFAVQLFTDGNQQLTASLQKIEAALERSTQRSDDQLAYYVAQAREIIDLSLMSQKDVIEELRQLGQPAATAAAAR